MRSHFLRKALYPVLCTAILCSMVVPASAFFWSKKAEDPIVSDVTRNVIIGDTLHFSADDFPVTGNEDVTLSAITITSLPDMNCGFLCIGSQTLSEGAVIRTNADAKYRKAFEILK